MRPLKGFLIMPLVVAAFMVGALWAPAEVSRSCLVYLVMYAYVIVPISIIRERIRK